MKTDIWKDNKTLPEIKDGLPQQIIAIVDSKSVIGIYGGDEYGNEFLLGQALWSDVEKWMYEKDFQEQSSKIERLEKVILDNLNKLKEYEDIEFCEDRRECIDDIISDLSESLEKGE